MAQTLAQWLNYLEQLHPKGIDLGLTRVAAVAQRLALSSLNAKVVTVAGTNGKGSTIATLESGLAALGATYASYTSPHILRFNERIRINGEPVADAQLIANFEQIEQVRDEISLSYFEFTTLAALLCFQQSELDVVLLEVGLGGRLDAVNIIDADIAIVCSIALDHQDWLGDTLDAIAAEKLGVARAGKPLLIGQLQPCAGLREGALASGAQCYFIGREFTIDIDETRAELRLADGSSYPCMPPAHLSTESFAVAAQTLALLGYALHHTALATMAASHLLGRFQCHVVNSKTVIFDVAHNPAAIERLCMRLRQHFPTAVINVVIGVMADKNVSAMLSQLDTCVDGRWFVSELAVARALAAHKLTAQVAEQLQKTAIIADASAALAAINPHEVLLICGSFYTVAAGMQSLQHEGFSQ